jgi:hypothetical protein
VLEPLPACFPPLKSLLAARPRLSWDGVVELTSASLASCVYLNSSFCFDHPPAGLDVRVVQYEFAVAALFALVTADRWEV